MLVLSRKLQEQIRIGDSIVITVLRIDGNKVRLGIEAPKETRVLRGELEVRPSTDVPQECEPSTVELNLGDAADAGQPTEVLEGRVQLSACEARHDRVHRIRAALESLSHRRPRWACSATDAK